MTSVQIEICNALNEFKNYLAIVSTQDKSDLNLRTQPCLNLLSDPILQNLINMINEENILDEIAINKIENLMQSVQYNHKTLEIENKFFEIFTLDKINSWKKQAQKTQAPGLVVCFGGTGNAIHLAGEAHNKVANGYDNEGLFPEAYVYNVPGVASDSNCIYDPDVLGVSGEITGRNPTSDFILPTALKKGQKSVAGIGLVEAVQDAYEHIRKRIEANQIAADAEITILGHSRGAVESLLLAKLLLNNPNVLSNRKLTVIAHDPVLGLKLPPGQFAIGNHSYNAKELMYLKTNVDPERVNITIPIAMSDFRHDEFALIDLAMYEQNMSAGTVTVEPHPGHHSAALVGAANINCNVVANQFDEKMTTRGWFRANFAGESRERQAKFDALHEDYLYLMEHSYLKKGKVGLPPEVKIKCIDIYVHWITENFDRVLGNPGYHAAITDSPRYVHQQYLSRVPGLFYNRHHEDLINSLAPKFYSDVVSNFRGTNPKELHEIIEAHREEFDALPESFKLLASNISSKNIKDNQIKQNEYNLAETKERMPMAFNLLYNMFLYPDYHAKKYKHAMHTKVPGIDKNVDAYSTLQSIQKALSLPKEIKDAAFALEVREVVSKFLLNPKDDSNHKDPSIRLQYFLTKEYCNYLYDKLNCKKINQEDPNAIARLRDNITKVNSALDKIGTKQTVSVKDKLNYISQRIIPTLKTGSILYPCSLTANLNRGIEQYKNSFAKLGVEDNYMDALIKIQNAIIGEGFIKQWSTASLGGVYFPMTLRKGTETVNYNYKIPTTMAKILEQIQTARNSKDNGETELKNIQKLLDTASKENDSFGTFFRGRDFKTKVFYSEWSTAITEHIDSVEQSRKLFNSQ